MSRGVEAATDQSELMISYASSRLARFGPRASLRCVVLVEVRPVDGHIELVELVGELRACLDPPTVLDEMSNTAADLPGQRAHTNSRCRPTSRTRTLTRSSGVTECSCNRAHANLRI